MGLKPKYKNEVTMTFRISNDYGNRKAIRSISNKVIAISGYKTFGYDMNNNQNPNINADILIFRGDAKVKTETNFTKENFPKPGDYIDVTGSLSTKSYIDKEGKEHIDFEIKASKVVFSEMEEVNEPEHESAAELWG